MNRILEQIKTRPLLFDGAFGTITRPAAATASENMRKPT